VGVGVRLVAGGGEGVGVAVTPVDDVTGDGVLTRIGDRAQRQGVRRSLVHVGRARQPDRRGDVVHGDREAAGIGRTAVLDHGVVPGRQFFPTRRASDLVGVGVRLVAGGGEGVGVAVTPVDDVTGDGVLTRIGDRAQGQRVGRPLVHVGRAAQTDGRGDVVHGD